MVHLPPRSLQAQNLGCQILEYLVWLEVYESESSRVTILEVVHTLPFMETTVLDMVHLLNLFHGNRKPLFDQEDYINLSNTEVTNHQLRQHYTLVRSHHRLHTLTSIRNLHRHRLELSNLIDLASLPSHHLSPPPILEKNPSSHLSQWKMKKH
jgi:hypothetical protein